MQRKSLRHGSKKQPNPNGVPVDAVFIKPWASVDDSITANCIVAELVTEMPRIAAALPRAVAIRLRV